MQQFRGLRILWHTFEQLWSSAHTAEAASAVCFLSSEPRLLESAIRKFSGEKDLCRLVDRIGKKLTNLLHFSAEKLLALTIRR